MTAALSDAERAELTEPLTGGVFAAGESLFREGDPSRIAFLLLEGRVRLLKRVRAAERSLLVARPGDVFGESALLDDAPRRSTAVALTAGLAIAMDKAYLSSVCCSAHPAIATHVAEQLVRRVARRRRSGGDHPPARRQLQGHRCVAQSLHASAGRRGRTVVRALPRRAVRAGPVSTWRR